MVTTAWKVSLNTFMDKNPILKKRVKTLNEFRTLNLGTRDKSKNRKGRMLAKSVTTQSQTVIKQWMSEALLLMSPKSPTLGARDGL